MTDRIGCCVPFCRRTTRNVKGFVEWICAEHWKAVSRRAKRLKRAAERRARASLAQGDRERARRVWALCKRQAIEAAGGAAMTGSVLEPSAQKGPQEAKPAAAQATCLNCGDRFPRGPRRAEFCGRQCIKQWENRRMIRGAELYDLVMILRYEREKATKHKVWRAINRLAARYREEDIAERGGRRSWRRLRSIIETKLFLWSSTFGSRREGGR